MYEDIVLSDYMLVVDIQAYLGLSRAQVHNVASAREWKPLIIGNNYLFLKSDVYATPTDPEERRREGFRKNLETRKKRAK